MMSDKYCPKCNSLYFFGLREYKKYFRYYYLCSNLECNNKIIKHKVKKRNLKETL